MVRKKNVLHRILIEESMNSREKRNTLMKQNFELCPIRWIWLEDIEVGSLSTEPEKKMKRSFYIYISPLDALTRYFGCSTVFSQFLESGKRCTKYDGLGLWHGDFFQSKDYKEVLKTCPENGSDLPPLCLDIYM